MRKRALITLMLEDDVVFSSRNATTGAHSSLDYIPGSALLGFVAARLYADLPTDDAWTVFHSGRVQFGNALPLAADGHVAFPVPHAWQENKADPNGRVLRADRWEGDKVFNLAGTDRSFPERFQPRSLRQGYVTPGGGVVRVARRYRMMTAIGDDGRASEGQLFGYESLAEGQHFQAELRFDDGINDDLVKRVLDVLRAGTLRLGRSKTTHYGRVSAELEGATDVETEEADECNELTLWLLADACLRDEDGQPVLVPSGDALGLPGATLVPERSFLRARRYSPWNAHRQCPEMERQVLVAGGTLVVQRDTSFTADEIRALSWRGIGFARALGLGRIAVNSPMLKQLHPQPRQEDPRSKRRLDQHILAAAAPGGSVAAEDARRLIEALAARAARNARSGHATKWVEMRVGQLCERWLAIRRYHGWPVDQPHGPGATQWGAVDDAASKSETWERARLDLFGIRAGGQNGTAAHEQHGPGLIRNGDSAWDCAVHRGPLSDGQSGSLREWLISSLESAKDHYATDVAAGLDALRLLAQEARKLRLWESERRLVASLRRVQDASSTPSRSAEEETT